jgi:uncharacterized membrane protein HdeD (DUF308 family)
MASFWISLAREMMALFLGIALLLQEDKTRPFLINFMGTYWLASGLIVLKAILAHAQARKPLGAGAAVVALGAGLGILLYAHFSGPSPTLVHLLGLVIILTGSLHVLGGFDYEEAHHGFVRPLVPLGLVEVVLGGLLLCSPFFRTQVIFWVASLWASLAGAILLLDAMHIRACVKGSKADRKIGADSG